MLRYSHQIFYYLFLLAFTSAYIIFHKFLELHSTLSEKKKKKIVTNFPFLTDSLNPLPHPLNSQNPLSMAKVFCRCSRTRCDYLAVQLYHVLGPRSGDMKYFNFVNVSILCKINRPSFCLILSFLGTALFSVLSRLYMVVNINAFTEWSIAEHTSSFRCLFHVTP